MTTRACFIYIYIYILYYYIYYYITYIYYYMYITYIYIIYYMLYTKYIYIIYILYIYIEREIDIYMGRNSHRILAELIHEMQQATMATENFKKCFHQMLKLN